LGKIDTGTSPKGVVIVFEAIGVCNENIFPFVGYDLLVLRFIQHISDGYSPRDQYKLTRPERSCRGFVTCGNRNKLPVQANRAYNCAKGWEVAAMVS